MRLAVFGLNFLTIIFFSFPALGNLNQAEINEKITEAIRPNWPFHAFLAIPRISEMVPMVSVEISEEEKKIISTKCVEIEYYQKLKEIEPDTVLERKALHELLCKAMKRALQKTENPEFIENVYKGHPIGLKFNFYNGSVELTEIPYPPLDPLLTLDDVFVDDDKMSFGGIDFPREEESEINETSL